MPHFRIDRLKLLIVSFLVLFSACSCNTKEISQIEQIEPIPLTQNHDYPETPYMDYSLADLPEFVMDESECIDHEKQYVLPDGYLYEYKPVPSYSAINQLVISTDVDGSVFNGCGYQNNARIRGILETGDSDVSFITGFIPIKPGDIVYFSGNCLDPQNKGANVLHTVFYDEGKNIIGSTSMQATEDYFEILEQRSDGSIAAIKVREDCISDTLSSIRFTLLGSGEQLVISINEPLVLSYENYSWLKGDKYIPEDWYNEVVDVSETINKIELQDESTVVKFIFATDIHANPDQSTNYTKDLGKVCAEVMRRNNIPFLVSGGDNCTQSTEFMPTIFKENMDIVLSYLSPIPHKNILLTVGNHDGETGTREYNGETVYYRHQLNNEQRSAVFFGWQRESNEYKHFDSDGTYYFIDDSVTKTRYILLNSYWSQWEGEEDGFVTDIYHSFGHFPLFGPQQLHWFAYEALDMPQDYSAVIITHFSAGAKDFEVFQGIVDAFSTQTTYVGSYKGVYDWQSTDIAVNYENAYGEIIAVFQGHRHTNAEYDYFGKIPCINTTTTGAYWAVRDENAPERIKGTASEFAVDTVVIDKAARKIYITRLGVGEDRIIQY